MWTACENKYIASIIRTPYPDGWSYWDTRMTLDFIYGVHITVDSRFRLSRPPWYTGHLAWHWFLARCLLHAQTATHAIPYTQAMQCWLPQTRFSLRYGRIWRLVGLRLNREQNDSLFHYPKLIIKFGVRSFLSLSYFLKYSHLAIAAN